MIKKWYIMGIEDISIEKWNNVKNSWHNKPMGGLWGSEYTPNSEFISPWYEWCDNEMPDWTKEYGVVFELKDSARIYTINTHEDLVNLYNKYNNTNNINKITKLIDFEKVSKDYDCIFLTDEGQWVTRFTELSLYGWDIESILVLNFDCIDDNSIIKIDKRSN